MYRHLVCRSSAVGHGNARQDRAHTALLGKGGAIAGLERFNSDALSIALDAESRDVERDERTIAGNAGMNEGRWWVGDTGICPCYILAECGS